MRVCWVWASAVCALGMAGCGGGGNESGSPDELFVSPSEVNVHGSNGVCASGVGPTVYVYGGQPPYSLTNSVPMALSLDRTQVRDSGDGFTISFINGVCVESMPITIEDRMGRLATVTVTNRESGG